MKKEILEKKLVDPRNNLIDMHLIQSLKNEFCFDLPLFSKYPDTSINSYFYKMTLCRYSRWGTDSSRKSVNFGLVSHLITFNRLHIFWVSIFVHLCLPTTLYMYILDRIPHFTLTIQKNKNGCQIAIEIRQLIRSINKHGIFVVLSLFLISSCYSQPAL